MLITIQKQKQKTTKTKEAHLSLFLPLINIEKLWTEYKNNDLKVNKRWIKEGVKNVKNDPHRDHFFSLPVLSEYDANCRPKLGVCKAMTPSRKNQTNKKTKNKKTFVFLTSRTLQPENIGGKFFFLFSALNLFLSYPYSQATPGCLAA